MKDIKEVVGNGSAEAAHNLSRDYMKTPEAIVEATAKAKSSIKKSMKDVGDYCRENPVKAVGIALGVGAVAALALVQLFRRRQSATERVLSRLLRTGEETWNHVKDGLKPAFKI